MKRGWYSAMLAVRLTLASLALMTTSRGSPAFAESPCKFSGSAGRFGAKGNTAALIAHGHVDVRTPSVYATPYTVEVGVWVDDALANLASDIPSVVLSYFEHANCIFAHGRNATTREGVHAMSLQIAGNRIHYYKQTTRKIPGKNAFWVQQTHHDWAKAIKALGAAAPKVNLLFSASRYVEIGSLGPNGKVASWHANGGASNGVGQGQALVGVDPATFRNGAKPFYEDWWGLIAAHELGHALGSGRHLAVRFDTMCCKAPARYSKMPGDMESHGFALSKTPWNAILRNNASTTDAYKDPYSTVRNPVTNELWDFPQIHGFLKRSRSTKPVR